MEIFELQLLNYIFGPVKGVIFYFFRLKSGQKMKNGFDFLFGCFPSNRKALNFRFPSNRKVLNF